MGQRNRTASAEGDGRTLAVRWPDIAFAAACVGLFCYVVMTSLPALLGNAPLTGVDRTLVTPLLLSIALVVAGWARLLLLLRALASPATPAARAGNLAARDPLTGFLNRRGLAEDGAEMFARATRRGKAMALLLLDLDQFKSINDLHGHATGDALLRAVAREIDAIIPTGSLSARQGGDEFACAFLFDPQAPETVDRIARSLVDKLSQPIDADGIPVHVSASIGIARSDFGTPGIDALTRCADIAMHAAKRGGRNRHCWFDRSMEQEIQARAELEGGLRDAIARQQIVPYFEQQIDLATGRISGFEVLARWEHPQRGTIQPDTFIPIAEETGLISDISLAIMRQAFAAARDWHPSLTLSVNISPYQLRDAWLAQKIIKVLTESGFPPARLEIEITESSLFDNLALAQSLIGSLKNQGIRLALDDFGTGYSSLAHLRALPFDRIKIDKSFVQSIGTNPDSLAIVKTIASLGESLNLPVTAEGIEDEIIAERLFQLGCAKGQGYMFGRPLAIGQVRRLLAERRLLAAQRQPRAQATSRRLAG